MTLFATYYCESTLFIHTHQFSWGTVTHSHPFNSDTQHSHSETACLTIATLSTIIAITVAAVALTTLRRRVISVIATRVKALCPGHDGRALSLRAPPAVA